MKRDVLRGAEKYIEERQRKKRRYSIFLILASITVICTVYVLIQSGRAMEPEHIHSQECYQQVTSIPRIRLTCSTEKLGIHEHISSCYDNDNNLTCGYADYVVHKHDSNCYDADGNLLCAFPEIEAHTHTAECYAPESQADLPDESAEDGAAEPVPICGKEEIILHEHTDPCYDDERNLICGQVQVLEHQHTPECFETVNEQVDNEVLTCTITDENHTHGPLCYGTWNLVCGKEEHRRGEDSQEDSGSAEDGMSSNLPGEPADDASGDLPGGISDEASSEIDEASSDTPSGISDDTSASSDLSSDMSNGISSNKSNKLPELNSYSNAIAANGVLNISLLYSDQKSPLECPQGESYYTHSDMTGFIRLEPSNLTADLEDAIVTLDIPKEFVEMNSIKIPPFTTNSTITKYTISDVSEDDTNYHISIHFSKYDKTQTLVLPFGLSFSDDVVPDNYELKISANVYQNDSILSSAEPTTYKPLYRKWGVDKFVNSNKNSVYRDDGAEAVVTPNKDSENPYLGDDEIVKFAFIVNNVINSGSSLDDLRDVCEVTLTDKLPTYMDKDGNYKTAVFDPNLEGNEGWSLNENGTVSKTYTGENSRDVLLQIYNDELYLKFPELKLSTDENNSNRLIANLYNNVSLEAVPSNEANGETRPSANDQLKFCITDKPGSTGSFEKIAEKGNIYDAQMYKTNPYPWKLRLNNKYVEPLENIVIRDRKIVENGEIVVKGLHDDLKFVKLESNRLDSNLPEGKTFADIVEKVDAYYVDGSMKELPIPELDKSGNFTIDLNDENKICHGFEIIFKNDYKMEMNGAVSFRAYTVYRDPDGTVVPDGAKSVTYTNQARAEYLSHDVWNFLWSEREYEMLPVSEELKIEKATWENDSSKNNKVGEIYTYALFLTGSLMTPDQKVYGDIRIVDLLPNEVEVYCDRSDGKFLTNGWEQYTDKDGEFGKADIIENYHNSGRTAVIAHITYDNLIKYWDTNSLATMTFRVRIREGAHTGTIRNDAYVVGDNLEEYTSNSGGTEDIYDLNSNGRTDDRIAYNSSTAVIVAGASIYAEKFIAPADSNAWNKQGLSLKAGSEFDYLLKVTNETKDAKKGLVVYDTLPAKGDRGIFGEIKRNSEFPVQLRNAIQPPEGYTVFYTTSKDVYAKGMNEMVSAENIWTDSPKDYSSVTAFKLVANEGTELNDTQPFEVRVPVKVPDEFAADVMDQLKDKTYHDQGAATMAYLEANNSFGYFTQDASDPKESNVVWARVPFAGFTIKKVDSVSHNPIQGAVFELKKTADSTFSQTSTSNESGLLEFKGLTEGVYTLTEIESPAGYGENRTPITVTITQNAVTMEYTVGLDGDFDGLGTNNSPLCIENELSTYELPATGGISTTVYFIGGFLLIAAASLLLYHRAKRGRE